MKHTIRLIILIFALVIAGAGNAWAISESDIIINVQPNKDAGTVAVTGISGMTVTISATPATGYSIDANHISAEKMVDPMLAPRHASGLASKLAITDNGGNSFSFTIPDGYSGAYVTVNFFKPSVGFTQITSLSQITEMDGNYQLTADVSGISTSLGEFTGTLDGGLHKIIGLSAPLFTTVNGGTVKNIIFEDVNISSGDSDGDAGAVCSKASGDARIYNCGINPSSADYDNDGDITGFTGSSVSGSRYVGSLVGFLDGSARVINCYSYANISGGTHHGGIVGYNNVATKSDNLQTMVMNCMFYGNISGGSIAPIYNGSIITNRSDEKGISNFNYFWGGASYIRSINVYNCALMAETRFLQRFEFFRHLLNSNRALAAWWATGSRDNKDDMMKWVLEPSQIGSSTPFPILKKQGYYSSVVNNSATTSSDNSSVIDYTKSTAPETPETTKTLSVTLSGEGITTNSLTLPITDKDPSHFNFNYHKVQLPYFNDVGTGNYTNNKVVTGWEVTVSGGANSFSTGSDASASVTDGDITLTTPYNFADRKSTEKDNYATNGNRIFNQGAYFDVPEGVTSITIKPHWANCVYVSDAYPDVVYNQAMNTASNVTTVGGGERYKNNNSYMINGSSQKVYTTMANAVSALSPSGSVYDNAIVLVGNVHSNSVSSTASDKPFTIMSIDLDKDNEPDCSYILRFDNRVRLHPVRVDFINIIGLGMAQKSNGGTGTYNFGILQPLGWFESTNTSLFRFTQFEYDKKDRVESPMILQGGVIEQWVTVGGSEQSIKEGKTVTYYHVGGNVWFKEFHIGVHQDKTQNEFVSPHPPISVTGGDFNEFYLTGLYNTPNANTDDNAECYINGGRFNKVAGTGMQGIGTIGGGGKGNIIWQIDNADINEFYAGGINAAHKAEGNIWTVISNSRVDLFCGGPKFGDMNSDKKVVTNATDCTFRAFFGAGYGGNSYNRRYPSNKNNVTNLSNPTWNGWVSSEYTKKYDAKYNGVETRIDYQFLPMSGNTTNVCRLFVDYVSFSLATTYNVTSKLTGCTITKSPLGSLDLFEGCIGNFYGGGSLGKVDGPVNSTLTNCTVEGSAFGAGYSATLPTVAVMNNSFQTEPYYDGNLGTYLDAVLPTTESYTWQHADVVNSTATAIDNTNHILYTTEDLTTLGTVTGKATLNIEGTTTVGKSVYGGGEESGVDGDTEVTVTSGTIGSEGQGGVEYGNVYGGGKGKRDKVSAGQVKGSTRVLISQAENKATRIYHNVYGGGAYGSVGDFEYENTTGMPTGLKSGAAANSGKTYVEITGGTFGWNGKDNGMVFGSSRGDVGAPGSIEDQMAWVYDTEVKIGTSGSGGVFTTPTIMGSVYGGGENGHNFHNSNVNIYSGTIGIPTGTPIGELSGAYYPYRGNVYGGGCGTDMYYTDPTGVENPYDGKGDAYNSLAGIVRGTATLNISGGYVVHNVYGAGAMGSVGNADDATSGKTTVNITGGRIGYDGERNGNVFGAARGEYGISTVPSNNLANVRESEVIINYATTPTADNEGKTEQLITGSVFGGGESGLVKESVAVSMTGGLILKDIYGGGALADTQTSNWDATNNTWAEGKTSASSTTTVRLTGGTILGEAYGGGLGESGTTEDPDGKPAYVYGNVLVDLNGTTSSGEEGTAIANDARGCAVHQVFGCNNANGTPTGEVLVHVYATQNKTKSQIGNTSGETPVTDAKTKGSYDVLAVYGGGNLAAYKPAGGKNTTHSTNVIIDGCGTTSIQQVYGGGNAASTPATKVTVNGTYEIEELFGGGNGKDDIVVNSTTLPNPGANVGFYAYEDDATNAQTPEDRATNYGYGSGKASVNVYGGTIHRVFGGSNTKGNVRQTAVTLLDDNSGCDFCVDEAYGGGKSAPMDAEAKLLMACIPGLNAAYGGAEAADIQGNVTLNISNGTFDRVFGGNNLSGTISGSITVNIEEIGCKPIIIGELYGGGNQAGYSVYGYDSNDNPKETGTKLYNDPEVNVKSFTSIGTIYGGGYGIGAKMVGSPTVNINEVVGTPETYPTTGDDYNATGFKGKTKEIDGHEVVIPAHTRTKIGAINNVFGGGNAAEVKGNTTVNIGTLTEVYLVKNVTVGDAVTDYYTRNNDGTYTAATGTAVEGTTYYEKKTVVGADIRGNVYGGGNNAAVTGNTSVNIGKKND